MNPETLFAGKAVLVTGAAGTIGRALIRRLLALDPARVVGLDNNESELFFLDEAYGGRPFEAVLGDVRDRDKMNAAVRGVDIVFHSAALKHVPLCQRYPLEAVQTNILGMHNVLQAAIAAKVPRVVFTSSDKAVNPTNVMGASKLMSEQLIAAALAAGHPDQVFAATRFGNVLGSRGSVVPLFREQIRRGGPVTLTDPGMTRFVMSLDEAVRLVLEAAQLALGGEIFVTKMPVVRMPDLARAMIEELAPAFGFDPAAIEVRTVGARPGEKMYEELMNTEETRRSLELARHFVVLPALREMYGRRDYAYPETVSATVERPYISTNARPMPLAELRAYLRRTGVLEPG